MNTNKKIIKEMTNLELAEEISKFNDDQMVRIKKSSVTNGIFSLMSIKEKIDIIGEENCNWKEELKEYKEITNKLVELFKDSYEGSKKEALEIREKLYTKKTIIDGYLTEFSYLREIIDEKGMETIAKENDGPKKSVNHLLITIEEKLNENINSHEEYLGIISEIIKTLPMCTVRSNYYDILKETLRRNFTNLEKADIKLQSENYKRQFDSRIRKGYGMEFDYYFMEIGRLSQIDFSKKEIEELESMISEIEIRMAELIEVKEITVILGIVSNMLIISDLTKSVDAQTDEIIKEWKEIIGKSEEEQEKFAKNLYETIYSVEKNIQSNLLKYEDLTLEASKREDFDYSIIEEKLKETAQVLSFFNDMSLNSIEYINAYEIEIGSKNYIEKHIEGIIQYMDRAMKDIGNFERKIRMRRILGTVPLPFFNVEEFKNYVRYSLDERLVDKNIANLKIQQIQWMLEGEEEE